MLLFFVGFSCFPTCSCAPLSRPALLLLFCALPAPLCLCASFTLVCSAVPCAGFACPDFGGPFARC